MRTRWTLGLWLLLAALPPLSASAHDALLDAYGCHSNKPLLGSAQKRECHKDLLAGKVFASLTDEYKAYIEAQKTLLTGKDQTITSQQLTIADLNSKLTACQANCPVPPPQPTVGSLTLSWAANIEPDLAGYRIYCGTLSHVYGPPTTVGKVVTSIVGNLQTGHTYYCALKAFDTNSNESPYSAEVSKVLP